MQHIEKSSGAKLEFKGRGAPNSLPTGLLFVIVVGGGGVGGGGGGGGGVGGVGGGGGVVGPFNKKNKNNRNGATAPYSLWTDSGFYFFSFKIFILFFFSGIIIFVILNIFFSLHFILL